LARYRLGVLKGDGIGPEIVAATLDVLREAERAAGELGVEWVPLPVGWEAIRRSGAALPEATAAALETCDRWILGPHDFASWAGRPRPPSSPQPSWPG
jgi:3-isopropylmalate dehydrogenase